MTGYLLRASWPILDAELHMSVLRVEAAAQIDAMAAAAGARITGEVTYHFVEGRLIAEAPAVPSGLPQSGGRVRWGSVAAQVDRIAALASRRWTDAQIADEIGCSESAVAKVRAKHRIPPGVGNPTLRGAA